MKALRLMKAFFLPGGGGEALRMFLNAGSYEDKVFERRCA
jgi:hypothetical protein